MTASSLQLLPLSSSSWSCVYISVYYGVIQQSEVVLERRSVYRVDLWASILHAYTVDLLQSASDSWPVSINTGSRHSTRSDCSFWNRAAGNPIARLWRIQSCQCFQTNKTSTSLNLKINKLFSTAKTLCRVITPYESAGDLSFRLTRHLQTHPDYLSPIVVLLFAAP